SDLLAYLDQDLTWTVAVANAGEGPVSNVLVRATLPAEVQVNDAGEAKVGPGSVEWRIATLQPGEQKTLKLNVVAAKLTDRAAVAVVATADAAGNGTGAATVGDPVQARAESAVAIIGTPALTLELEIGRASCR